MSGINGFNFLDNVLIQKMNDVVKHCGPDDSGIFANGTVTLGHQRLSIIDLSSA
jgi:asparagine synthase (glutamine-hydrolysing)